MLLLLQEMDVNIEVYICKAHLVHVFEDARTMPRDEDHMEVILHEDVHSKEEVMALGMPIARCGSHRSSF